MIPQACKRLAEVDFPIAEVSRHAVREKSIRHGHPSTLHLWWARRPLASSRSILLALLLPDPGDDSCPDSFKVEARTALLAMHTRPSGWDSDVANDEGLRRVLLNFIADFANWDNSSKPEYIETGRALVRAAHGDETPLVVDPFAGGGSIPLEALRLGCETFASDLNPVAGLILKVLLEEIPRHGPGLADELRRVGTEIKEQAKRELADLYPKDPDGATPIAYLWARTVRCESPNCGAEIPLMRTMWLCNKPNRKFALRPNVVREDGLPPHVEFEIFKPESAGEVANSTVSRAKATCVCCSAVLPPERVRLQLAAQRGGADAVLDSRGNRTGGARMTAVITLRRGERGRHYRLPTDADYAAVRLSQERVLEILGDWERGGRQGLSPVPDEPTPLKDRHRAVGSQLPLYNMATFGDLFVARQKVALVVLSKLAHDVYIRKGNVASGGIGLSISKQAERLSSLASWITSTQSPRGTFARQALGMVWDFLEMVPIAGEEEFPELVEAMSRAIELIANSMSKVGHVQIADAVNHPLPDQSASVWFTDPPYYDAIPYADLSDFFFVWLKRTLPGHSLLKDPFEEASRLTPKNSEVVMDKTRLDAGGKKDRDWFVQTMSKAFTEGRRVLSNDGIGAVVFAHKTTEGWEALLAGLIAGGWTITASWPISTERSGRLNAHDTASLATSVHLICRPRPGDAPIGEWADVLRELPVRVGDWMERLQREGIRGADLVFACVGPALEVYSKYSRVETAEGREVGLAEFLERIWEVVGREALEQVLGTPEAQARNGAAGALEEDARLTALFLWTMQSNAETASNAATLVAESEASYSAGPDDANQSQLEGSDEDGTTRRNTIYSLPFDVTRRFAQPLGIDLETWRSRIIKMEKGTVRLMPVSEREAQLFEKSVTASADALEQSGGLDAQMSFFEEEPPKVRGRSRRRAADRPGSSDGDDLTVRHGPTTLDRIHAAMLLQSSGRSQALRSMLRAEQDRGPDFLRLADALSALYPRGSEEKRLLDAMVLAVPR